MLSRKGCLTSLCLPLCLSVFLSLCLSLSHSLKQFFQLLPCARHWGFSGEWTVELLFSWGWDLSPRPYPPLACLEGHDMGNLAPTELSMDVWWVAGEVRGMPAMAWKMSLMAPLYPHRNCPPESSWITAPSLTP